MPPPLGGAAGLRYHSLSWFLRRRFGHRVWKISIDAGFGCPNVDGAAGTAGCMFCNMRSFSPSRRGPPRSIAAANRRRRRPLRRRNRRRALHRLLPARHQHLRPRRSAPGRVSKKRSPSRRSSAWRSAPGPIASPTRCSTCWPSWPAGLGWSWNLGCKRSTIARSLGSTAATITPPSSTPSSGAAAAGWPSAPTSSSACPASRRDDMLATAREIGRLGLHSVKLHNLYAVRDTPLADAVAAGQVRLPGMRRIRRLRGRFPGGPPPGCVVDRLQRRAPPEYLVGPHWCGTNRRVRAAIEAELARRDTWQGHALHPR